MHCCSFLRAFIVIATLFVSLSSGAANEAAASNTPLFEPPTEFALPELGITSEDFTKWNYERFLMDIVQSYKTSSKGRLTKTVIRMTSEGNHSTNRSAWYDEAWNQDALAFFAAYAQWNWHMGGTWTPEQLIAQGESVVSRGCHDPGVLYVLAKLLQGDGRIVDAYPLLAEAIESFPQSDYPTSYAYYANRRFVTLHKSMKRKEPAFRQNIATDALISAIENGEFAGWFYQRQLVANAADRAGLKGYDRDYFLKKFAEVDGVDECTRQTILGGIEIVLAWEQRGNGTASSVTEEGYRGFRKHLRNAYQHLTKAHELDSTRPEAATKLITVAMANGTPKNEPPSYWFDQATTSQIDFNDAYNRYQSSLMPRWGGSHRQMLQFGVLCAQTELHETYIPYRFLLVLLAIEQDEMPKAPDFLKYQEVYEMAVKILDERLSRTTLPGRRSSYQSMKVAFMWRAGHKDEARALAESLGDRLWWRTLAEFDLREDEILQHPYSQVTSVDE